MQQRKEQECKSLPNVEHYYQSAVLEHLLQWWNLLNKSLWEFKQFGIAVPLREWALSVKGLCLQRP